MLERSTQPSGRGRVAWSRTPDYDVSGLLTLRDTCEWLRVSKATLYRIMARGELEWVYAGSRRRFTHEGIERYLRREAGVGAKGNALSGPLADWVRESGYWMCEEVLSDELRKRGAIEEEIPALVALGDELAGSTPVRVLET